jgi:hypothetical protein
MSASATVEPMGKKKPSGGSGKADGEKRPTPRKSVALPLPWYQVAEKLAEKGPTPIVWYLVQLIKEKAEAAGVTDLPLPPWKTDEK